MLKLKPHGCNFFLTKYLKDNIDTELKSHLNLCCLIWRPHDNSVIILLSLDHGYVFFLYIHGRLIKTYFLMIFDGVDVLHIELTMMLNYCRVWVCIGVEFSMHQFMIKLELWRAYTFYEPVKFDSFAFLAVGFPCVFGNSHLYFFFCCFPFHPLSNILRAFCIMMTIFVSRNCQVYLIWKFFVIIFGVKVTKFSSWSLILSWSSWFFFLPPFPLIFLFCLELEFFLHISNQWLLLDGYLESLSRTSLGMWGKPSRQVSGLANIHSCCVFFRLESSIHIWHLCLFS